MVYIVVYIVVVLQLLSHVQLFATPWAVAQQSTWHMGFPGKDTGVGCHLLLQRAYRDPQIVCSWLGFPQDKRIKMISASSLAHTPSLNLLSMCAVLSCF